MTTEATFGGRSTYTAIDCIRRKPRIERLGPQPGVSISACKDFVYYLINEGLKYIVIMYDFMSYITCIMYIVVYIVYVGELPRSLTTLRLSFIISPKRFSYVDAYVRFFSINWREEGEEERVR